MAEKRYFIALCIFLVLCFFFRAEAADLKIKTSLSLSEEYNDNLYLSASDKTHEYISYIEPSFNIIYRTIRLDMSLDYTFRWIYYSRLKDDDTSHLLNASTKIDIVKNFLYLDLSDEFSKTIIDPRRPSTETNITVNKTDRNIFSASPYLKINLTDTLVMNPGYRYYNIWFRDPEGIDRVMHEFFNRFEKKLSLRAAAGIESIFIMHRPERGEDSELITNSLYYSHQFSQKSNMTMSVGYRYINFGDRTDKKFILYRLSFSRALDKGDVTFNVRRDTLPSAQLGIYDVRSEEISIRYGTGIIYNLNLIHEKSKYLETDRVDESYAISPGITLNYNPWFQHRISAGYRNERLRPEKEERERYMISTALDYSISEKDNLILSYGYTSYNSSIDRDEYEENIITIKYRHIF
ncbi:MAG: TIGR03016 family PEP-CTERM system-associated outer membrane protein [Thermodesulfovibrionales bacterium]|nr:TIGR03016 family PEP-CTERM system-associated outer membrane protein [Thermodesulfovibrionales bacterium]